ncbi:flagellar protein FliS [Tindallia magadiensis]|uniref:Flagellar protein FliS n=1 Tax=Tindallia magadiensis TaxID=69895 RepID=A0A1I3CA70_9FIRM|nr:flagellar export chaperone FliS [Tindallia magadiensis]SFH71206.1 flagellar protein FliS [Tindallia magadiensis]
MTDQEKLAEKVENASPVQLVVMMLGGLDGELDRGINAVETKEEETLKIAVDKARAILTELLATLWGDSEVAISSRQVYIYLNKLITDAGNRSIKEPLEEAKKVLEPILEGWQHLEKNPSLTEETSNQKGPSIVAGMTYGKGTLNESLMDGDDRLGKG